MQIDVERGSFGTFLRQFRLDARLSQEQLAERANLSVEGISALERGRRRAPYRGTIRMLSAALGLSDDQRRELEKAAKRTRQPDGNATRFDTHDAANDAAGTSLEADELRHRLIRPLSSFHGRGHELRDLAQLVSEHALVSVVGAGGIGKTRVAVELSWALLDRYRDGVWFVDLAPLSDHADVARSLIMTLSIRAEGQAEIDVLLHHLARRNALLVIDNCEHVVKQVAILVETLLPACPALRILTTSREPLHVAGERVYRMPSLESPPALSDLTAEESLRFAAVALFVDRSRAANAAFVFTDALTETIGELCRRLDGIALAIELAASRSAVLSPQQILKQLEHHFRILAGGSRTALPRQRTMLETIRWSYDRLTEEEQALFRRTAIFANGFTWNAMRSFTRNFATRDFATLDVLTSVVDKSLVTADTSERVTRYRLLGPMRAYGLEMLSAAGEREAAERFFAMWSLDFARLAHAAWETESSTGWSALVEPELDNLRASVLWALEDGYDVELGQRIVATIRRIWARFVPAEGRRWIEAGRQAVHETTSPEIRASLSIAEAHVYTALEQYSTAFNAAKECESYFVAAGDDLSLAEARGFAGLALIFTGDSAEGERLIASSVHVYQQRGAKQLAAYGVSDLGISHLIRGDLPGARKLFQKALRAFRDLGNERGASSVAANLAEVEFCTGADREAVRLCQEALALSQTGREARMYLANLAAYLVRLEQYDEARERARQSIMCSGIERADADVACALQHLAAVAALRASSPVPGDTSAAVPSDTATDDLVISAARLSGFVDSRLAALEKIREYTEQQEYERLVVALESRFGTERLEELRDQGQAWTEDDAVSAALRI